MEYNPRFSPLTIDNIEYNTSHYIVMKLKVLPYSKIEVFICNQSVPGPLCNNMIDIKNYNSNSIVPQQTIYIRDITSDTIYFSSTKHILYLIEYLNKYNYTLINHNDIMKLIKNNEKIETIVIQYNGNEEQMETIDYDPIIIQHRSMILYKSLSGFYTFGNKKPFGPITRYYKETNILTGSRDADDKLIKKYDILFNNKYLNEDNIQEFKEELYKMDYSIREYSNGNIKIYY